MYEQSFVDFSQPFEDGGIGGKVFAHFDKRANDIHAHGNGARAVKDSRRHESAVFGERVSG